KGRDRQKHDDSAERVGGSCPEVHPLGTPQTRRPVGLACHWQLAASVTRVSGVCPTILAAAAQREEGRVARGRFQPGIVARMRRAVNYAERAAHSMLPVALLLA